MRSKILIAQSDKNHRGVGRLPLMLDGLEYQTVSLEELAEHSLEGIGLVVYITNPRLKQIAASMEALHRAHPGRSHRVMIWMPDRNRPKVVEQFIRNLSPESFDGIFHVAEYNRQYWQEEYPEKLHELIQNPWVGISTVKSSPTTYSVLTASGTFTKFKGLGNLLAAAPKTADYPEIAFAYTGAQYSVTKQGKISGPMELMSMLTDDLRTKKLRDGLALRVDDDWHAKEKGKLNVFPAYSDRMVNRRRIEESGVYLFTPLSVLRREQLGYKKLRAKNLSRWTTAVDFNLLEAMETGTLCLISTGYREQLLKPLEEEAGVQWPLPTYDTMDEAFALAESLLRREDYGSLSRAQRRYLVAVEDAMNVSLERTFAALL